MLTQTKTTRHRKNKTKKIDLIQQKKNFAEIKKFVIVTKKLNAKTMRQNKRIERIEKSRLRNKMKIIKQIEMINRKKKREKIKIQKKLKRTFRFKRIYRKRFREFRNQKKSFFISMNSILEMKNNQIRNFTLSMKKYVYFTNEFNVDFIN